MAHQHVGAAVARRRDRGAQGVERLEAEPVHAGVEMQRRGRRRGLRPRQGRPAEQLGGGADRRREAEAEIIAARIGVGLQPVEHIDARVGLRQQRPQRLALADLGDEEDAAAGGVERRRDRLDPQPVAVGLDHRRAIAGRRTTLEQPPIVGQRGGVDRQRRGGGGPRLRRIGARSSGRVAKFSLGHGVPRIRRGLPGRRAFAKGCRRELLTSPAESARWTNSSP